MIRYTEEVLNTSTSKGEMSVDNTSNKRFYSFEQLYSKESNEKRLVMQRVSGYAKEFFKYARRSKIFYAETRGNYYEYISSIYLYGLLSCDEEIIDNLAFPELPQNIIEIVKEIIKYRQMSYREGVELGIEIPFSARVISVLFSYEELVYNEPYDRRVGNEELIDKIAEESGTEYDPEIVEALRGCRAYMRKKDIEYGMII